MQRQGRATDAMLKKTSRFPRGFGGRIGNNRAIRNASHVLFFERNNAFLRLPFLLFAVIKLVVELHRSWLLWEWKISTPRRAEIAPA